MAAESNGAQGWGAPIEHNQDATDFLDTSTFRRTSSLFAIVSSRRISCRREVIDARAAIIQIRALADAGTLPDNATCRRLALRATSAIPDKDLAGRLEQELVDDIEFMGLLAELNKAESPAKPPRPSSWGLNHTLDRIEKASRKENT